MFLKIFKIASLCTVPFISSIFVNPHNNTANNKYSFNSYLIHQMLVDNGWAVQSKIYNTSERRQIYDLFNPTKKVLQQAPQDIQSYLSALHPKNETFVENFKKYAGSCRLAHFARIPVKNARVHDAELLIAPTNTLSSPTVVLYHGNAGSRCDLIMEAREFCKKGYNVLLSSYAGDRVFGNRPKDNIFCTEACMRQDAEADLQFLCDMGVTCIGVYGRSLGGSQAVNLADAIDLHNKAKPQEQVCVALIFLDKTFTSATAVSGRFVENKTGSKLLGSIISDITAQHLAIEKHKSKNKYCDGLDTKTKLERFKTHDTFKNTHLILVGASHDEIMGGKKNAEYDPSCNMILELQVAASNGKFKAISQFFLESTTNALPHHNTPFYTCRNKAAIISHIPSSKTIS